MKSNFEIYSEVNFTHQYFESDVYTGITVTANEDTKNTLLNYGLLLIFQKGGFTILFDKYHAGLLRSRDDVNSYKLNLTFILTLKDKQFYTYTNFLKAINYVEKKPLLIDLKKNISSSKLASKELDITKTLFNFNNYSKNSLIFKNGYTLHNTEYVTENDYFISQKYFANVFGEINFQIDSKTKKIYYIRFASRSTYWNYVLASPFLNDITNPIVIDEEGIEEFSAPIIINFLNRKVVIITSKNSLLLCQYSKYRFKLVHDYNVVTGKYKTLKLRLPGVDINHISNACSEINNKQLNYSEIFL